MWGFQFKMGGIRIKSPYLVKVRDEMSKQQQTKQGVKEEIVFSMIQGRMGPFLSTYLVRELWELFFGACSRSLYKYLKIRDDGGSSIFPTKLVYRTFHYPTRASPKYSQTPLNTRLFSWYFLASTLFFYITR